MKVFPGEKMATRFFYTALVYIFFLNAYTQVPINNNEEFDSCAFSVGSRHKRAAEKKMVPLWDNKIVPYQKESTITSDANMDALVESSIAHIEEFTCIDYIDSSHPTYAAQSASGYLSIVKSDSLCAAYIGKIQAGAIELNLADSCVNGLIRTPVHEFLHSLGFMHEFQRTDRDNYVTVNVANIKTGFTNSFTIQSDLNEVLRYDISSVMQYTGTVFTQTTGQRTMDPVAKVLSRLGQGRDNLSGFSRGDNVALSHRDKASINKLYNCAGACTALACENGGYQDKNCVCQCPFGFTGNTCQTLNTAGLGTSSDCSDAEITAQSGTIAPPQLSGGFKFDLKCLWRIKGAPGQTIRLRITEIHLPENAESQIGGKCGDTEKLYIYLYGSDVDVYPISCADQDKTIYLNQWSESDSHQVVIFWQSIGKYQKFEIPVGLVDVDSATNTGWSLEYEIIGTATVATSSQSDQVSSTESSSPSSSTNSDQPTSTEAATSSTIEGTTSYEVSPSSSNTDTTTTQITPATTTEEQQPSSSEQQTASTDVSASSTQEQQTTSTDVSASSTQEQQTTSTDVSASSTQEQQTTSTDVSVSSTQEQQTTSTDVSVSSTQEQQTTSTDVSVSSTQEQQTTSADVSASSTQEQQTTSTDMSISSTQEQETISSDNPSSSSAVNPSSSTIKVTTTALEEVALTSSTRGQHATSSVIVPSSVIKTESVSTPGNIQPSPTTGNIPVSTDTTQSPTTEAPVVTTSNSGALPENTKSYKMSTRILNIDYKDEYSDLNSPESKTLTTKYCIQIVGFLAIVFPGYDQICVVEAIRQGSVIIDTVVSGVPNIGADEFQNQVRSSMNSRNSTLGEFSFDENILVTEEIVPGKNYTWLVGVSVAVAITVLVIVCVFIACISSRKSDSRSPSHNSTYNPRWLIKPNENKGYYSHHGENVYYGFGNNNSSRHSPQDLKYSTVGELTQGTRLDSRFNRQMFGRTQRY